MPDARFSVLLFFTVLTLGAVVPPGLTVVVFALLVVLVVVLLPLAVLPFVVVPFVVVPLPLPPVVSVLVVVPQPDRTPVSISAENRRASDRFNFFSSFTREISLRYPKLVCHAVT